MWAFQWADQVRSSPFKAWGLAFTAFIIALMVRFGSDHLLPVGFPYLTFFPAVILTTFFAGLWPGITCATLSGLAAWYWFIAPAASFAFNPSVTVALLFYVAIVGVDILLIQVMHHAVSRLHLERERTQVLVRQQKALIDDQHERQRQQRVLQRELSHRMKNTLAMVQAVVSQSLRNATDMKDAAIKASARIQALAVAQDMLTATDWVASSVQAIVEASVAPHCDDTERVQFDGPEVLLEAQQALGLSLAIHELATNATKYGALSSADGRVHVSWDAGQSRQFRFLWEEHQGPVVVAPTRKGFGSKLTERIVPNYFGGSAAIDFKPAGLKYELIGFLETLPKTDTSHAHPSA